MRPALPRLLVSLLCLGCFVDEGVQLTSDATGSSGSSSGERA